MTIRAKFDGNALVPVDPVDLEKGEFYDLEVIPPSEHTSQPGSPAAILKAMREAPHIAPEDVDELERNIEEGKMPIRDEGVFDDLRDE